MLLQIVVADMGAPGRGESEGNAGYDISPRSLCVEEALPVSESTLTVLKYGRNACVPIDSADFFYSAFRTLTICPDVLDRRGAHCSGNA